MNKTTIRRAIFLDRDGVLNKLVNNRPPWSLSEIEIYSEACSIIKVSLDRSYLPIIITNQPDAGRGSISYKQVDIINNFIASTLGIKNSYICKHPYDGMCTCRKPLPGMLLNAKKDHGIDLSKSLLVGDREKDILAGNSVGCTTIQISTNPCISTDYSVENHKQLVKLLLSLLT